MAKAAKNSSSPRKPVAAKKAASAKTAAARHPLQNRPLHLQVPGVVVLAGLEHRAGGRDRVSAALDLHLLEGGLVGIPVELVDRVDHEVAGAEEVHLVGTGAERLQIEGGIARGAADVGFQGVLGKNLAVRPDGRRGLAEAWLGTAKP